jgi:hypothetical protein
MNALDTDEVQITEVKEYTDGYGILASAPVPAGVVEGTDEYELGFSVYKDETDWVPQIGQWVSIEGVGTITGITHLSLVGGVDARPQDPSGPAPDRRDRGRA